MKSLILIMMMALLPLPLFAGELNITADGTGVTVQSALDSSRETAIRMAGSYYSSGTGNLYSSQNIAEVRVLNMGHANGKYSIEAAYEFNDVSTSGSSDVAVVIYSDVHRQELTDILQSTLLSSNLLPQKLKFFNRTMLEQPPEPTAMSGTPTSQFPSKLATDLLRDHDRACLIVIGNSDQYRDGISVTMLNYVSGNDRPVGIKRIDRSIENPRPTASASIKNLSSQIARYLSKVYGENIYAPTNLIELPLASTKVAVGQSIFLIDQKTKIQTGNLINARQIPGTVVTISGDSAYILTGQSLGPSRTFSISTTARQSHGVVITESDW